VIRGKSTHEDAERRICFVRDTLVTTKFGSRPIGEIDAGDEVLAFDFEAGEWRLRRVQERRDSMYDGPIVTIETGSSRIETTVYHPFWVVEGRDLDERSVPRRLADGEDEGQALAGRWVNSHELRAGDVIFTRDGQRQTITRVEQRYDGPVPVSNLSIEDDHTFAVGEDGVLVHNESWCQILLDSGKHIPQTLIDAAAALGKRIHGHHIVMKGLWAQLPFIGSAVRESVAILKRAGITDHVTDLKNLCFALNWDHSIDYARSVLRRLQKAEADWMKRGGDLYDHVKAALDEIADFLEQGLKYRYP
jgi:hypothetical protein